MECYKLGVLSVFVQINSRVSNILTLPNVSNSVKIKTCYRSEETLFIAE